MRATTRDPADCRSMNELRVEIDRLDAALLELFAQRSAYIHRAAEIKQREKLPAEIPDRVEEVISNVHRHAEALGLPAELYTEIWEKLVRRAIAEEDEVLSGGNESENPRP